MYVVGCQIGSPVNLAALNASPLPTRAKIATAERIIRAFCMIQVPSQIQRLEFLLFNVAYHSSGVHLPLKCKDMARLHRKAT